MFTLPTDVAVLLTRKEDGRFVDFVPSFSVEEAIAQAGEMAQPCCKLARSAELDSELFMFLTSYPFIRYPRLYSTI